MRPRPSPRNCPRPTRWARTHNGNWSAPVSAGQVRRRKRSAVLDIRRVGYSSGLDIPAGWIFQRVGYSSGLDIPAGWCAPAVAAGLGLRHSRGPFARGRFMDSVGTMNLPRHTLGTFLEHPPQGHVHNAPKRSPVLLPRRMNTALEKIANAVGALLLSRRTGSHPAHSPIRVPHRKFSTPT